MSKLLLYCTKAKPYLVDERKMRYHNFVLGDSSVLKSNEKDLVLNGKIVAECDFEVEEHKETTNDWLCMSLREKIVFGNLCEKANIDELECYKYADGKPLYAIHIKNLHIFDKPRELYDCLVYPKIEPKYYGCEHLSKAPQNMMYAELDDIKYILISIRPQWMCLILNRIKDVEVRKVVLKEMIK